MGIWSGFPSTVNESTMGIQFLGKLQFALKKGNMQLFDEATMQRFATVTSSSPFEMLPAEQKMPALFGSVVLLVIVVGLFLFKAVPPYLAKMKAEKIASTVDAVKTAEPEQIYVPLLRKRVINAKFQDNLNENTFSGTYEAGELSESEDSYSSTTIYIKPLRDSKAEVVISDFFSRYTYGDDEMNDSNGYESIETLKQAEIVGNALISETRKGRFATINIRDRNERVTQKYGFISDGIFYVRIGDLPATLPKASESSASKPETKEPAPQPPTRVEEKQPTPSVPNEPPAASSGDNSTMGIITGDGVRMRSSMDKTSKTNIIDKFAKGTRVEILERHDEWVKVRVKGKVGYIASQFVE
jgi:hypothetical protein